MQHLYSLQVQLSNIFCALHDDEEFIPQLLQPPLLRQENQTQSGCPHNLVAWRTVVPWISKLCMY